MKTIIAFGPSDTGYATGDLTLAAYNAESAAAVDTTGWGVTEIARGMYALDIPLWTTGDAIVSIYVTANPAIIYDGIMTDNGVPSVITSAVWGDETSYLAGTAKGARLVEGSDAAKSAYRMASQGLVPCSGWYYEAGVGVGYTLAYDQVLAEGISICIKHCGIAGTNDAKMIAYITGQTGGPNIVDYTPFEIGDDGLDETHIGHDRFLCVCESDGPIPAGTLTVTITDMTRVVGPSSYTLSVPYIGTTAGGDQVVFFRASDGQGAMMPAGDVAISATDIRDAVGLATANLDTQLGALPTAAEIADDVWDETLADHDGVGSTGEALDAAGAGGDAPSVADMIAGGIATEASVLGNFSVTAGIVQHNVVRDGSKITVVRGDTRTITFTLGSSWPLTGKKVYFTVKARATDDAADAVVAATCTVTDAVNGVCTYTPAETDFDSVGRYTYDVEVRNTDESSPETVWIGPLVVTQDVRQ